MKPAPFDYARPVDVNEALRLLADRRGAKLIAGGQSLGPMLNLRLVAPELLIDISRLAELTHREVQQEFILIGAGVRHAEFEDGRVPGMPSGWFERVASQIAYRAVRNRGTLGGSLAHADPAADWPGVMIALGALVHVRGADGKVYDVPCAELSTGVLETCLEADEMIESMRIPRFSADAKLALYKISAKPGDFAEALAVVVHDPTRGHSCAVLSGSRQPSEVLVQTSHAVSQLGMRPDQRAAFVRAVETDLALIRTRYNLSVYEYNIRKTGMLRALEEISAS